MSEDINILANEEVDYAISMVSDKNSMFKNSEF